MKIKFSSALFSGLLLIGIGACNPAASAPIRGTLQNVVVFGSGRFVLGTFVGNSLAVWDLDKLGSPAKAVQVVGFRGTADYGVNSWMNATASSGVSSGGAWLIWRTGNEGAPPSRLAICALEAGFPCKDAGTLDPQAQVLSLSVDGSQVLALQSGRLSLLTLGNGAIVASASTHAEERFLGADWDHGFLFFDDKRKALTVFDAKRLKRLTVALGRDKASCESAYFSHDGLVYANCVESEAQGSTSSRVVVRLDPRTKDRSYRFNAVVVGSDKPGHLWQATRNEDGFFSMAPVESPASARTAAQIDNERSLISVDVSRGLYLMRVKEHLWVYDLAANVPLGQLDIEAFSYRRSDQAPLTLLDDHLTAQWFKFLRTNNGRTAKNMLPQMKPGLGFETSTSETESLIEPLGAKRLLRYTQLSLEPKESDKIWLASIVKALLVDNSTPAISEQKQRMLTTLMRAISDRLESSNCLSVENFEAARESAQRGLRSIGELRRQLNTESLREKMSVVSAAEKVSPDLPEMVAVKGALVETELEIVCVLADIAEGRFAEADKLLGPLMARYAGYWRVQEAAILRHLRSPANVFNEIVERAQKALDPEVWEYGGTGGQKFFDPAAIEELRRIALLPRAPGN